MAPRAYNLDTRRQQQSELRSRIVAATAEMHAAKGVVATSYADIAERAGVSLPTVYSHFPTPYELIKACTGHVIAGAPALPIEQILGAPDLHTAAERLVAGMDRLYAHMEPWMAWHESQLVPALAEGAAGARQQKTALIVALLSRHPGSGNRREQAASWESLLSFDLWHRMVRDHKLPRRAVRRILVQLLLAVVGPQPAAPSPLRPRRTK